MIMKRFVSVLLVLLLAFGMAACGSDDDSTSGSNDGEKPASSEKSEPKDSGTLGDYDIKIKESKIVKDWEGKDSIAVKYDFTNNSDEAVSFDVALHAQCFQNGVELSTTFRDSGDSDTFTKEVKPGSTFKVEKVFQLSDKESDVEAEVSELITLDTDAPKISKIFKVK